MKSVIQKSKECIICGRTQGLELHHVFHGTANRKKADEDGMTVYLCHYHHTGSNYAVHLNANIDNFIKEHAQEIYERTHTREEFIKRYGKSYL